MLSGANKNSGASLPACQVGAHGTLPASPCAHPRDPAVRGGLVQPVDLRVGKAVLLGLMRGWWHCVGRVVLGVGCVVWWSMPRVGKAVLLEVVGMGGCYIACMACHRRCSLVGTHGVRATGRHLAQPTCQMRNPPACSRIRRSRGRRPTCAACSIWDRGSCGPQTPQKPDKNHHASARSRIPRSPAKRPTCGRASRRPGRTRGTRAGRAGVVESHDGTHGGFRRRCR